MATPVTVKPIVEVGDYLVAQWGYDANIVSYFKVLKRTGSFVEIAEVHGEVVDRQSPVYDGRYVVPSNDFDDRSIWGTNRGDGAHVLRRKVRSYPDGTEFVNFETYAHLTIWDGRPCLHYNHH